VDSNTTTPQLLDIWRRQLELGAEVWTRMIAGTPLALDLNPIVYWRPVIDQMVMVWAQVLSQLPLPPDLVAQWKQFVDQWIEAWSRAFGLVMGTEAFAQLFGQSLDQLMAVQAPFRKVSATAMETTLSVVGLPSRNQVTGVARQLVELEERVERLEDLVQAVLARLEKRGVNGRKEDRRTPRG
jgi:Poly(R)-hydroxyalkanoic acid synthase subunit (PHA_synth_III_E)